MKSNTATHTVASLDSYESWQATKKQTLGTQVLFGGWDTPIATLPSGPNASHGMNHPPARESPLPRGKPSQGVAKCGSKHTTSRRGALGGEAAPSAYAVPIALHHAPTIEPSSASSNFDSPRHGSTSTTRGGKALVACDHAPSNCGTCRGRAPSD